MGNRPSSVLEWTDGQERAAVHAALPAWEFSDDDVIFCMSWYEPGWRDGAAPSAPLTVQVRRAGVDLAVAEKGSDFDEVSIGAPAALALAQAIGIEPWAQLQADLEADDAAEEHAEEAARRQAKAAADTAVVYEQAAAEAVRDAERAAAHAEEHPDDEQLQQVAAYTASQVQVMRDYADQAATKAAALASAVES